MIYLIGSLRNLQIPVVAGQLRDAGFDVFDDWYSPGSNTDEEWQRYENQRGRSYIEALSGHHAKHVFEFDKRYLDIADAAVLLAPAGKSAHLELGYMIGQGKPGFILLDREPERYDIMMQFATAIYMDFNELVDALTACTQRDIQRRSNG